MVSCNELQQQLTKLQTSTNNNIAAINVNIEKILKEGQASRKSIEDKIDAFGERLQKIDVRLNNIELSNTKTNEKVDSLDDKLDAVEKKSSEDVQTLKNRIAALERKVQTSIDRDIPKLTEDGEDRTNRQLRKTLIFRNVDELNDDESFKDTKELLANLISTNCRDINYESAVGNIDRAHRESKRNRTGNDMPSRQGKRLIFAVFHSWDFCQQILEAFRIKNIREQNFNISADQMYGPITSRRRKLAFQKRR